MKTFRDYDGIEGIDKLMEAAPYINEIMNDTKALFGTNSENEISWIDVGGTAIKEHKEACYKIMGILDREPESSIGAAATMAKIMFEILLDKDLQDFFTSTAKIMDETQSTAATATSEEVN